MGKKVDRWTNVLLHKTQEAAIRDALDYLEDGEQQEWTRDLAIGLVQMRAAIENSRAADKSAQASQDISAWTKWLVLATGVLALTAIGQIALLIKELI